MNEVGAWSWESGWIARDLHCGGWFPQSWSLDHHTNHSQLHQFRYCDSLTDVIMVIVYQSNGNVHFDTFRLSYHIRGLPFSCPRALLIPNPFDWNTEKGAHASSILLTNHNKIQNAKCGQKSRRVFVKLEKNQSHILLSSDEPKCAQTEIKVCVVKLA